MPEKGKLPQWEKEENRKKVFLELLKTPMSHKDLLETLKISRGTLSKHLRDLEEDGIIGKTRRNGKRVYQIIFDDEEKIMDELKAMHFDLLLKLLSDFVDPLFVEFWKSYSESILRGIIYFKKRAIMGSPELSIREMNLQVYETIKKSASPRMQKMMYVDEILNGLKETSESDFYEINKEYSALKLKIKKEMKNKDDI
jgi:predicted transcriptional regulator